MAFTLGLTRSICAMKTFTTSVAESFFALMSLASVAAGWKQRSRSVMSHQHDVVLFLRVAAFDLHRHRLADEIRQHREGGRFLFLQQVDHGLRGEDAEFLRLEGARLAQDLAQDVVANGARGLDGAAAFAYRTRLAQDVGERLARALARHLDQAERGESAHRHARAVARQRALELVKHRGAMLFAVHVDEVDDDDAAEVAQAQLAGNRLRRLQVGLEDRLIEVTAADEA